MLGAKDAQIGRLNLAYILIARDQFDEARYLIEPVLNSLKASDYRVYLAHAHAALLPCEANSGDPEAFERRMAETIRLLKETSTVDPDIALAAEAAGRALASSRPRQARRAFKLAAAQWRALGNTASFKAAQQQLALLKGQS